MRDQKQRQVSRQAYAGLLWSKQFYYYVIEEWLKGDSTQPPPPASRLKGRNFEWLHLFNMDIISMPDKWEYPWYASWDLAFHMIPMADIDVSSPKISFCCSSGSGTYIQMDSFQPTSSVSRMLTPRSTHTLC